jgi:hypothetical protein
MTFSKNIKIAIISILGIALVSTSFYLLGKNNSGAASSSLATSSMVTSFSAIVSSQSSSVIISSSSLVSSISSNSYSTGVSDIPETKENKNKTQQEKYEVLEMRPCSLPLYSNSGKCFSFSYNQNYIGENEFTQNDKSFLLENIEDIATEYNKAIKSKFITPDYWLNTKTIRKMSENVFIIEFFANDYTSPQNNQNNSYPMFYKFTRTNEHDGVFEEIFNYNFPENRPVYIEIPVSSSSIFTSPMTVELPYMNPKYLIKEEKTKTGCDQQIPHTIIAEFGCFSYYTFYSMYKPAVEGSWNSPDFQENNYVIATGNPQKLYSTLDQVATDYLGRYIDKIYSNRPGVQVYYAGLKSPGVHLVRLSTSDGNFLAGPGDVVRFYTDYEITENQNGTLSWRYDSFIAEQ